MTCFDLNAFARLACAALLAGGLSACGTTTTARDNAGNVLEPAPGAHRKVGKPYQIDGVWYYPDEEPEYVEEGMASWYGPGFEGRKTANGEIFRKRQMSAAHRTMPMPSYAKVTNLENGQSVIVRVNDRGPFKKNRIIDLSEAAAEKLGFKHHGVARVRVEYAGRAELPPTSSLEPETLTASVRR
jgi:rare lipoprotein A